LSGDVWSALISSAILDLELAPSEAKQLTPKQFWAVWDTKYERVMRETGRVLPATREDLDELKARFPDGNA